MTGWRFRIARDKDGRFSWRLVNAAGTTVMKATENYPTEDDAREAAEHERAALGATEITNGSS
jgi:uncharacterized protein YegP (UPF0339 family)